MAVIKKTNLAELLIKKYGYDSLSYFSLNNKKKLFFSSTGRSFLAYSIVAKTALVTGDPIGPKKDIIILVKEFSYFTKGANLKLCFLAVSDAVLPTLIQYGQKKLSIGNEAIIDLKLFNKNLLKKKVKRAERHVASMGIVCEVYEAVNLPINYLKQLKDVSSDWLKSKNNRERGLSMTLGRIPQRYEDCLYVVAVKDEKVLGYLTFVPIYSIKSLSLDASRRVINAPNGLTEFLFLQAIEKFKANNYRCISLNFVTFYTPYVISLHNPLLTCKTLVYKSLSRIYKTHDLYRFNNKFLPQWKERYVTFEKKRHIPYHILAIVRAEL